jgi:hypothetical protein
MEIKLPPVDVKIFPYNLGRHVFRRDLFYSDDRAPGKTLESCEYLYCLQLFQELLKWLLTSVTVPAVQRLGSLNASVAYNDLKRGELVGDIPGRVFRGKRQRAEFSILVLFGKAMLEFQMLYMYQETVSGVEYWRKKPVGSIEIKYGDEPAS